MAVVSNTRLFNVKSATDYYAPLVDIGNNQFYVFTARHMPWANSTPAIITDSFKETEYTIFEEMICGKNISTDDVKQMIDRNDWTSGTKYAMYDDTDADLLIKKFFVVTPEGGNYHVFKCLNNNSGIASTSQPLFSETSADDTSYTTADGYQWKYMYSISSADYSKFSTASYIPVVANASVTAYSVNGSIDSILVVSGGSNYLSTSNGYFSEIAVSGNTRVHALKSGSSANNNFYTGSAVYIESGTGAGQIREITDYQVTANQYLVSVDTVFSPQPDLSSKYIISPRVNILGDGTGAKALASINSTSKALDSVQIINVGSSYTYANVQIIGNTGSIVANSAGVRAIISPRGGHGADINKELNANKIGISVTLSNTESNTISTTNDYSRVGVIKNPVFANVALTLVDSTGSFTAGEEVIQYIGSNTAVNLIINDVAEYSYNAGNYVNLNLSAATTLTTNNVVYQTSPSAANGVVINVSGNTVTVRQDSGKFSAAATIFQAGNASVNNVISTITSGLSNTLYGLDSSNTLFSTNSISTIEVSLNGTRLLNHDLLVSNTNSVSYTVNSTAVLLYNKTLSNTDIITINKYIKTALLSNSQYSAIGTVVTSNSTAVSLTSVTGKFVTGFTTLGLTSGIAANVSALSSPYRVFSQTLKLTGTYSNGSASFALDDYCEQGIPGQGGAFGYIQDIRDYANGTYQFSLTGVKGTFQAGADKYIESESGNKIVAVSSIVQPDLIKYTGDIIYAENIESVQRANTQSETIKLVFKYY
jgi:hypothetical protein